MLHQISILLLSFINKYIKQNPDMIKQFRQATKLKKDQPLIIRYMKNYVDHYCKDQHVFELMFNYNLNINCENLIRHAIGKENSKNYIYYDTVVDRLFQDIIQEDWDELSQVLIDIKTDDDTTPTVVTPIPLIKFPVRLNKTNLYIIQTLLV